MRYLIFSVLMAMAFNASSAPLYDDYGNPIPQRAQTSDNTTADALSAYAASLNKPEPAPTQTQTCTTRVKRDVYGHFVEVTTCN